MEYHDYRVIITREVYAATEADAIRLATEHVEQCSYSDVEVEVIPREK